MTVIDRAKRLGDAQALLDQQTAQRNKLAQIGAQTIAQDETMQRAKEAEALYAKGAQDGLAALKNSIHEDLNTANITNEEVNTMYKQLGRMPDAKEIQELRRYRALQHFNDIVGK